MKEMNTICNKMTNGFTKMINNVCIQLLISISSLQKIIPTFFFIRYFLKKQERKFIICHDLDELMIIINLSLNQV